jgi:hypothetical protein
MRRRYRCGRRINLAEQRHAAERVLVEQTVGG